MPSKRAQPKHGLIAKVCKYFDTEASAQRSEVKEDDADTVTLPSDDEGDQDHVSETTDEEKDDSNSTEGEEKEDGSETSYDSSFIDDNEDELNDDEENTDGEGDEKETDDREYILIPDSDDDATEGKGGGSSISSFTDPEDEIRSGGRPSKRFPSHDEVKSEHEDANNRVAETSDPEARDNDDDSGNESADNLPNVADIMQSRFQPQAHNTRNTETTRKRKNPYRLYSDDDEEEFPNTLDDDGLALKPRGYRVPWSSGDEGEESRPPKKQKKGDGKCRSCGRRLLSRKERDARGHAPTFQLGDNACHVCDV